MTTAARGSRTLRVTRAVRVAIVCASVLGSSVLAAGRAGAEPSRVGVVRPPPGNATLQEATTRLSAELTAAGLDVVFVDAAPATDARGQVEGAAETAGAFATIAIVTTARGAAADVWVVDRVTKKTSVRRVEVSGDAGEREPARLAIRAAELLRASLLEAIPRPARPSDDPASAPDRAMPEDVARWVGAPPPQPPAPAAPPPSSRVPPRMSPPPLVSPSKPPPATHDESEPSSIDAPAKGPEIAAGVAFVNGVRPGVAPVLRVAYRFPFGLAVSAGLVGPSLEAAIDGATGSAQANESLATIDVLYRPHLFRGRFQPFVSLGAGLYDLDVTGTAKGRGVGQVKRAFGAAGGGGVGLDTILHERFALRLDGRALFVTPRADVQINKVSAGVTSLPLTSVALSGVLSF